MSRPSWSRAPLPWRTSLGAVIVATDASEQVLEGSAAALWELLDQPCRDDDLVARAQQTYGLDAAETGAALDALVAARLCRST